MQTFLLGRLLQSAITLFAVLVIVFALARSTGDPAYLMLPPTASNAEIEQMRHELGTDRSLIIQFGTYVRRAATGDLGNSIRLREPVAKLLSKRFVKSVELAAVAMAVAVVAALVLGTAAAVWRNTPIDLFVRLLGILGQSAPNFWLGIVLVELFAVNFGLLPASGSAGFKSFILPATVMGWGVVAGMMRLLRSQLLEVLESEYIRTARAKGLRGFPILWKHALRNAIIPVLAFGSLYFSLLLAGSVVIETVFAWPGMGQLAYQAVVYRDFALIQGVTLLAGALIVVTTFLVDLLYGVIDPRISVKA